MNKRTAQTCQAKSIDIYNKEDDKLRTTIFCLLAIIGVVAEAVGIAYATYYFFTPDYLEDFNEDCDYKKSFFALNY